MVLFSKKPILIAITLVAIGLISYALVETFKPKAIERVVTTVDTGTVRQLVSVSGVVKAEDTAFLAFPVGGVVTTLNARKGDNVEAGAILATLNTDSLLAERASAIANLNQAKASLAELEAGTRVEKITVENENVSLKRAILENTNTSASVKVANARKSLLSNDLSALSDNPNEEALGPIISGTYTCDPEGVYNIEVFSSQSSSGYSFRLTGLETGTFAVSTEQPTSFGKCGLRAQFSSASKYHRSFWTITIPNKQSPTYTTLRNAYELAKREAENDLRLAEQELVLALASAKNNTASARPEAIDQARAVVAGAVAKLVGVEAAISDRTLVAPFAGVIVDTAILPGETVTTSPVITLQAPTRFELTARIPEIDISRLALDQKAEVVFDTKADETLGATIDFLSPRATTIDGVAYYEARLVLDNPPVWLRGGLNADIDIVIDERESVTRLPSRFVKEQPDGTFAILREVGETVATSTVEILFRGNDGFIAVTGLTSGDRVVAP